MCRQIFFGALTLSKLIALVRLLGRQAALMIERSDEVSCYAFDSPIAARRTFSIASATFRAVPFVIRKLAWILA